MGTERVTAATMSTLLSATIKRHSLWLLALGPIYSLHSESILGAARQREIGQRRLLEAPGPNSNSSLLSDKRTGG